MSLPRGVVPVEDVQYRMLRVVKDLGALVGVHDEVEICRPEKGGPTLCHNVDNQGLDLLDEMSASIIRIYNLVGLEQAFVFVCGEVASNLWCQNIVVRVSVSELLHWLEVYFQNDGSVRSSGGWLPARWSVKR